MRGYLDFCLAGRQALCDKMQVVVVVAGDDPKAAWLDDQQVIDHAVQEIAIVANEEHCAIESD
jgi:hypothetical protein